MKSHKKTRLILLLVVLSGTSLLCFSGCAELFDQTPTEKRSEQIRQDVRNRIINPEPTIVDPNRYFKPPEIKEYDDKDGKVWKLTYFCRNFLAGELKEVLDDQFAVHKVSDKGAKIRQPNFMVTTIEATNVLIVGCPKKEQAKSILDFLVGIDIPPIQVKIDCLIVEIYADWTMDRETTNEIQEMFGENITAGGSARPYGGDVIDYTQEKDPFPSFPGASLREIIRTKMGLTLGYMSNDFLLLMDILESRGFMEVLMNPVIEIVNGKTARVSSSENVPLETTALITRDGFIQQDTRRVDVVDSLEITPHVFADGIGIETTIVIGSNNIPDGVKQVPILTKREIYNEQNRIRPGESLVIGGIRKSEKHSVNRGFPVLKDIPLVGMAFSGEDNEERAVEFLFILTPSYSSGGIPQKQMMENMKKLHEPQEDREKSPEKE
jgi:type II secretory pathway component GspD/PulD (secretin)